MRALVVGPPNFAETRESGARSSGTLYRCGRPLSANLGSIGGAARSPTSPHGSRSPVGP